MKLVCSYCHKERKVQHGEDIDSWIVTPQEDFCIDCLTKAIDFRDDLHPLTLANLREDEIRAIIYKTISEYMGLFLHPNLSERWLADYEDISKFLTSHCILKLRQIESLKMSPKDSDFLDNYRKSEGSFYERVKEAELKTYQD